MATTYHQLDMIAQDQRWFTKAEGSYRQALDIYREIGDRHSAARTYHQLGLSQVQRRFAEAEASSGRPGHEAGFEDRHSAARI